MAVLFNLNKEGYMAKKKEKKKPLHYRFFMQESDVPVDADYPVIIFKRPKSLLNVNRLMGLNYQGVTKQEVVNNLILSYEATDSLRRELAHERIRSSIMSRRLVEHGLSTSMDVNELREYNTKFADSVKEGIDMIISEPPKGISEEIFTRIRSEMGKVSHEIKMDYRYNVLRIDTQLAYNDKLIADVMTSSDRKISLKDRTAIINRLSKEQRELIKEQRQVYADMGVSLKDNSPIVSESKSPTANSGLQMKSLTSMMKGGA